MFYDVTDIMCLIGIAQTKAYEIIRSLGNDLASTRVPGMTRNFCKPPAGKIQKKYFCERYNLDPEECDREIARKSSPQQGENAW